MDREKRISLVNISIGLLVINLIFTANRYYLRVMFFSLLLSLFILFLFKLSFVKKIFKNKYFLLIGIFIFLIIFIFNKYGLFFLNRYIYQDDYPGMYFHNKIGVDCLRQGSIFGWDSSFLGGDVNIAYANGNLSLFCFPLIILFGTKIGVNLLLMILILVFPFLIFILAKVYFENENISKIALLLSVLFLLILKTLIWGNFNCLVAIDMVVVDLIFYNLYVKNKRYSSFLLVLSMTLTLFAHPAFFIYASIIIFAFELLDFKKARFIKSCILFLFIILATSHFLYFFIKYHTHFIEDARNFISPPKDISPYYFLISLWQAVKNFLNSLCVIQLRLSSYNLFILILLPLFFELFRKNRIRYFIVGLLICLFIVYMGRFYFGELAERPEMLLPVFLCLILSYCFYEYKNNFKITFFLFLVFFIFYSHVVYFNKFYFERFKNIKEYNPSLAAKISQLEGNLILLEQRGHNNYLNKEEWTGKRRWNEIFPNCVHIESLLQLQTNKRFYGFFLEGYAHTKFRGNNLVNGTHKGKWVDEYDISYFNREMTKWGIKYLVLWSKASKDYFGNHKEYYRFICQSDEWHIYEFLNADTRSVVVETGEGDVFHNDGYRKTVELNNVIKGQKAIIRSNYFPAWKAYFEDKEIKLFSEDGQMAFYVPQSGNVKIELYFPKYKWLSLLSISSLLCSFYLSHKRIM